MRARRDNYEQAAVDALQAWSDWIWASDYPSTSLSDPDKWSGVRGTEVFDAMVGKAAVLKYSGAVKTVHELVMSALDEPRRKLVIAYYIEPVPHGMDVKDYAISRCRCSPRRFRELHDDVILILASLLRLRISEMACAC